VFVLDLPVPLPVLPSAQISHLFPAKIFQHSVTLHVFLLHMPEQVGLQGYLQQSGEVVRRYFFSIKMVFLFLSHC
jgi:hypothetical protein